MLLPRAPSPVRWGWCSAISTGLRFLQLNIAWSVSLLSVRSPKSKGALINECMR